MEKVVLEKFSFISPQEGKYKYPESEFAGIAHPNMDNAEYDLEKETGVLTVDNGAADTITKHPIQYES